MQIWKQKWKKCKKKYKNFKKKSETEKDSSVVWERVIFFWIANTLREDSRKDSKVQVQERRWALSVMKRSMIMWIRIFSGRPPAAVPATSNIFTPRHRMMILGQGRLQVAAPPVVVHWLLRLHLHTRNSPRSPAQTHHMLPPPRIFRTIINPTNKPSTVPTLPLPRHASQTPQSWTKPSFTTDAWRISWKMKTVTRQSAPISTPFKRILLHQCGKL